MKKFCLVFMSVIMSNIPHVALSETIYAQNEMIPTSLVLNQVSRNEAEKNISEFLQKSEVQNELIKQGVSSAEIKARLAHLSEQEIQQLAGQVKEVRAGGDILYIILIVVLILFLVKRI